MRSVVAEVTSAEGVGVIDVLELKTESLLMASKEAKPPPTLPDIEILAEDAGGSSGLFFARWTKSARSYTALSCRGPGLPLPFGQVCPLLAWASAREDRGEKSAPSFFAVCNSASDLVEAIENALSRTVPAVVIITTSDLTTRGGGLFHNLIEAAILYRVELVNDYGVSSGRQGVRVQAGASKVEPWPEK